MATSKPAPSGKPLPKSPRIVGESEKQNLDEAIQRRISERAFDLYEASGCEHGNDHAHWLRAEAEVLQHGLEIRESGSWLAINASLPDVSGDDVQVYLEPNRVIVRAEKTQTVQDSNSRPQGLTQQELFLLEDLHSEVDPSTASAAFRDQKLTLMVKKRHPGTGSSAQQASTKS
jgi:HSP20 family molecular chaperone IbpA